VRFPALALQLLDLRQRLLAEHGTPRRRDGASRRRTEPRVARARGRQRPPGAARGAKTRIRRSSSTTPTCASAIARSSRGRNVRACRSRGCWPAATRRRSRRSWRCTLARSTPRPKSTRSVAQP
jgi:hypothetical protein